MSFQVKRRRNVVINRVVRDRHRDRPRSQPAAAIRCCWSPGARNGFCNWPPSCRDQHGIRVDPLPPLDLADDARGELVDRVSRDPVAGLCNSAGFGTNGAFYTLPIEREREEVVLNALALMELTHAALPGMVERGAGAVLNIALVAEYTAMQGIGWNPAIDAMFSTAPAPRSTMPGSAARVSSINASALRVTSSLSRSIGRS